MKTHSFCGTEIEVEYAEIGRAYHRWRCLKCDKIVPRTEINDSHNLKNGNPKGFTKVKEGLDKLKKCKKGFGRSYGY